MSKVEFSIVITAHNEGILLHKTLRSVFDAAKQLRDNGIKYEIIIHVDNGDRKTLDYLKRYSEGNELSVIKNNFGDLGQSRNYVVKIARGEFVSFLDGDDLISPNWYLKSLKILKASSKDCVVHPEAVLTFRGDSRHVLTMQKKSEDTKEDLLILLSANRWGSVVTAKREIFMKVPYMSMNNGYCYEDYAFNVQTLERKILHLVAPETVLFYRRSMDSMLSCANSESLILPMMKMFDLNKVKKKFAGEEYLFGDDLEEKICGNTLEEKEKTFRDNIFYKKVRGNWFLNYLITPFLRLALEAKSRFGKSDDEFEATGELDKMGYEEVCVVPDFVLEAWRKINRVEIQLYPKREDLNETLLYDAKDSIDIGKAYVNLSHSFTQNPDYVFIVPWVVMGGADKVLINYIKALLKIHPDWHVAVITTLSVENRWADRLPKAVDLYEFGNMAQYLSDGGADVLFSLLITQLGCKKLHIINSEFGYSWVGRHNSLVKNNYDVNVSFFAEERVVDGEDERIVSFENPYLFDIFGNVKNVFTDNKNIVKILVDRNAFDEDKFKVHYQPADFSIKRKKIGKVRSKKILWAGRIDVVKMPELVFEIGKKLDNVQIDMYGVIANECYDKQMFEGIKNVNYCGEYKSFDEISTSEYDLFLYTSKNDGIPNTILEATAAGLPIIASNDGGVGEFIINNETGILVKNFTRPDEYIRAICDVYDNKYNLEEMVDNAQKMLKKRHGWDEFIKLVKRDIK